jgi:hypothetical protein
MEQPLEIRLVSEADLEPLVRFTAAFRDHLGLSTSSEADFRASLALLFQDASTEFILACSQKGTGLGYVQARYRYSAYRYRSRACASPAAPSLTTSWVVSSVTPLA